MVATSQQQQSIDRFSDPRNLDASAAEVFGTMFSWDCRPDPGADPGHTDAVVAVIGLAGALNGACIVRAGTGAARSIAARLTGMEFAEVDETVQDAMGELCNMLAGAWKGRHPELAAQCGLSVPAVITGHDYHLRVPAPAFELHRAYRAEDVRFEVTIVCDRLQ